MLIEEHSFFDPCHGEGAAVEANWWQTRGAKKSRTHDTQTFALALRPRALAAACSWARFILCTSSAVMLSIA
jgi:hypothetical protein